MSINIMIIDDVSLSRKIIMDIITGFSPVPVEFKEISNNAELQAIENLSTFDLFIIDFFLPDCSGADVYGYLLESVKDPACVIISEAETKHISPKFSSFPSRPIAIATRRDSISIVKEEILKIIKRKGLSHDAECL